MSATKFRNNPTIGLSIIAFLEWDINLWLCIRADHILVQWDLSSCTSVTDKRSAFSVLLLPLGPQTQNEFMGCGLEFKHSKYLIPKGPATGSTGTYPSHR